MTTRVKSIIFDFDGVIAQSVDIKTRAFAYLFRQYSEEAVKSIVKYHVENGGRSRFLKFKYIHENIIHKPYDETIEKRLSEEFSKFVFEEVVKCPYVPGAAEFIEKHSGSYIFFIVSGTPDGEMKQIAEARRIAAHFRGIYGSPVKKGQWVKSILEKNDFKNSEAIFIGDSLDDYKGAAENGCHFIGVVADGAFNAFKDTGCKYFVKDLTELENVIKKIEGEL